MKIRFATISDRQAVLGLLDELIDEVNRCSNRPPKGVHDEKARNTLYDDLLKRQDVKIFVAEDSGKVVAVADVFINPIMRRGYHQAHIEDFVVTGKMRGKGVGSRLLQAIKEYCKQNNITKMKLTSGLELQSAHKFYENHNGKFTEKMFRFEL